MNTNSQYTFSQSLEQWLEGILPSLWRLVRTVWMFLMQPAYVVQQSGGTVGSEEEAHVRFTRPLTFLVAWWIVFVLVAYVGQRIEGGNTSIGISASVPDWLSSVIEGLDIPKLVLTAFPVLAVAHVCGFSSSLAGRIIGRANAWATHRSIASFWLGSYLAVFALTIGMGFGLEAVVGGGVLPAWLANGLFVAVAIAMLPALLANTVALWRALHGLTGSGIVGSTIQALAVPVVWAVISVAFGAD